MDQTPCAHPWIAPDIQYTHYQRKHDAARRVEKRFGGAAFGVYLSAVVIAAHKFPFLYCRLSGRVHKTNDPEFRYEIQTSHPEQ
jgi:hypothetical protein